MDTSPPWTDGDEYVLRCRNLDLARENAIRAVQAARAMGFPADSAVVRAMEDAAQHYKLLRRSFTD